MKPLSTTVVLHVSDLDRAVKYYTDILGFTFDFKFGDYAGLFYGEAHIHLCGPANQGTKKAPGSAHWCVDCDEVDAYYDLLTKKEALIVVPLEDRSYGVRDFAVNDPDGNTVVFSSAIA